MIARNLKRPKRFNKSFLLLGPRGTGKTLWVRAAFPGAIYLDLLDLRLYAELLAMPGRIHDMIPDDYDGWVIIDEIQKIPLLLNEVHRFIESQGIKFVLTGSSARGLRKKGVNLLAGRAIVYHFYPLTAEELGDAFDFKHALQFGLLPALQSEPDPKAFLKTYINTYLREEVLQEGLTRNLSAFTRFLEVASCSQGSLINMSAIARDIGIQQKMVVNYFDILEDLLIAYRIPVFNKRAKRKTVSHPKFYFFDVGVYQQLRPRGIIDTTNEINGVAFETLFLQEIMAINEYHHLEYEIYYWRTQAGVEVDFILYGPNGFHAFEIKHCQSVDRAQCKGLRSFAKEYPEAKLYLIHGGERTYYFDQIIALPLKQALKTLIHLIDDSINI